MIRIGDAQLHEDEIERVEWRDGELTITTRWPLEMLPVLIDMDLPTTVDLPGRVDLRWIDDVDPEAVIPACIKGWAWTDGRIKLRLSLDGSTGESAT